MKILSNHMIKKLTASIISSKLKFIQNVNGINPKSINLMEQFCYICGNSFILPNPCEITNLRETILCHNCGATMRQNNVAQTILKATETRASSLSVAANDIDKLKIYVLESYGPIYNVLSKSSNTTCSEYWNDIPSGTVVGKVRCEDVQNLSFPDESFNIIISQDVFEHVPDPELGFKEIYRTLKVGGYHIFTVPYSKNLKISVTRARYNIGKINHVLPPVYHEDGLRPEGILVYTDFGLDFGENLKRIGFQFDTIETEFAEYSGGDSIVFVCKK